MCHVTRIIATVSIHGSIVNAGRVPDVVANVQLIQTNLLTVADDYLPTALRANLWGAKSHRELHAHIHTHRDTHTHTHTVVKKKKKQISSMNSIDFPRNEIQRGFRCRAYQLRREKSSPRSGRDVEVINAAYKSRP